MLLVPYLSPDRLREIESKGLSGIDACGNGVITVRGRLLVYRTGMRNKYPDSKPIKNVYRGDASLVPRALVRIPRSAFYERVSAVRDQIIAYGGSIALSTVSKALKRLEEELLIERRRGRIRWLQGDELLARLAQNYEPPKPSRPPVKAKCRLPLEAIKQRLVEIERQSRIRIAATGLASVSRYAVMAREQTLAVYCSEADRIFNRFGKPGEIELTEFFANLELFETQTQFAYFDIRRDQDGFAWASPVQTYLELMSGDKRERETAEQIVPDLTDWNRYAEWARDE
ncbi:MAG: hypothetical protein IH989_08670 [Planctomycetes bacterium]|nr:hypothetical protein [Planctomycetota bacterium]